MSWEEGTITASLLSICILNSDNLAIEYDSQYLKNQRDLVDLKVTIVILQLPTEKKKKRMTLATDA